MRYSTSRPTGLNVSTRGSKPVTSKMQGLFNALKTGGIYSPRPLAPLRPLDLPRPLNGRLEDRPREKEPRDGCPRQLFPL